jgi:hypothetical protein
VFASYTGTGASSSSEQLTPGAAPGADEQFTGIGESDTVAVSGLSGGLSAQSSNMGIVTVSTVGNAITVNAAGAGTTTITVTDTGNNASATYTVSVTTTTIPVTARIRQQ